MARATLTCYISTVGTFLVDFEPILLELSIATCAMGCGRLRWRASFFLFFFLLLLHFVKHFVDFAFLFVCRPSFFLASAAAVDYYGRECQRGRVLAEGYQYVAILQPEHR